MVKVQEIFHPLKSHLNAENIPMETNHAVLISYLKPSEDYNIFKNLISIKL